MQKRFNRLLLFQAITVLAISGCGSHSNFDKWMEEAKSAERRGDYSKQELLLKAAAGEAESQNMPEMRKTLAYMDLASCFRNQHRLKDEEHAYGQVILLMESPTLAGKIDKNELEKMLNGPRLSLGINQKNQGNLAEAKALLSKVQSSTASNIENSGTEHLMSTVYLGQVLIRMQEYAGADKEVKLIHDQIHEMETALLRAAAKPGASISNEKVTNLIRQIKECYSPICLFQQTIIDWKLGKKPPVPEKDFVFSTNDLNWSPELIGLWADFLIENQKTARAVKVYEQLSTLCDKAYGPNNSYSSAARANLQKLKQGKG